MPGANVSSLQLPHCYTGFPLINGECRQKWSILPFLPPFFTVSLETNSFSGSRAQTAVKIVVAIYC